MENAKDGLPRCARNDELPTVTVTMNGEVITGQVGERPDDAHPGTQMPLPVPPGGWPPDEFSGLAGKFVRDPFTGVRSRAVE